MSFIRGAFVEIFSFLVWALAVGATLLYTSNFASLLPIDQVQSPQARATISAVILFTGILFFGGIIKSFMFHFFFKSKHQITDRLLGGLVGMFHGALIVSLLVLAANLAPELKWEQWWQQSEYLPQFQSVAGAIHSKLPFSVARHFDF